MALSIQMFFGKKNFDCQKAERWFKERRIPLQLIDLNKKSLSRREFDSVVRAVGLCAAVDTSSKEYAESPIRFSSDPAFQKSVLFENQKLLRTPVVRCGAKASVGFSPELWEEWIRS